MNRATLIMVACAAVTLGGALWMAPDTVYPAAFEDTGEPLFRDFTDFTGATSLAVVAWNEDSAKVTRFKVEQKAGRWVIPSHHDYPADAAERLGKAAASFIDVKRDIYYGDKPDDHARFGLLDPEDTAGKADEKATRFTLKEASGAILVDIFVGRTVPGKDGFHYVRLPDSKRVYGSELELDISTRFTDWIEQDLLQIDRADVVTLIYDPYRVDEKRGRVIDSRPIRVDQPEGSGSGTWALAGAPPRGKKLDESKIGQIVSAIDRLQIVGVRPRPTPLTFAALRSRGFFVTPDGSQLYGNEGEVRAVTKTGIVYTLYFGEVTFESGLALTAGKSAATRPGPGENDAGVSEKTDPPDDASANRYLFVDVKYDPALDRSAKAEKEPVAADAGPDKPSAEPAAPDQQADHAKRAAQLQQRFAPWFFVISDSSFKTIHKQRDDLFKES